MGEQNYYIVLFLVVFTVQFYLDYRQLSKEKCDNPLYTIVLLIHHYLSGFLYFGPLFFNFPEIHLLISVIVVMHWQCNNNECEITNINNELCQLGDEYEFKDFIYWTSIEDRFPHIHYYILFFWIVYNSIVIYQKYASPRVKPGKGKKRYLLF